MQSGIMDELVGIDCGDQRLNRRSQKVLESLSVNTQASINGSFATWSETQAAYRLLDNPRVTPEAVLKPHAEATLRRMAGTPVALIVQDTTELDYSKHPPKDAKCLTKPDRLGLYLHVQLAVTSEGLPLGVVGSHTFDRDAETLGEKKDRNKVPIEEKESIRWLNGYRRSCQIAAQLPQTQIVSIADREADMYDILLEAQEAQASADTAAHYVIRSKENRQINERVPPAEHDSHNAVYRKLYDTVRTAPVRYQKTIKLPATAKRKERLATLEVRAETVTLKHPKNRKGLADVRCNVLYVREVNAPDGAVDEDSLVEWWLITSLPIDSIEQIELVIEYYRKRWMVEVYFRVLKTGCRVEEIGLETVARLTTCLAFYQIIAWSVLCVTHLNRETPDLPCTAVFCDSQWQPVWRIVKKQKLPQQPPTLAEFVKLLAALGGYNNRPKEPPPGPQPIWIGIRRMHDFAEAWQAFGPGESYV